MFCQVTAGWGAPHQAGLCALLSIYHSCTSGRPSHPTLPRKCTHVDVPLSPPFGLQNQLEPLQGSTAPPSGSRLPIAVTRFSAAPVAAAPRRHGRCCAARRHGKGSHGPRGT